MTEKQATNQSRGAQLAASDFAAVPRAGRRAAREELHVCRRCASELLVYPVDWAPADDRTWRVELRCPDCEWRSEDIHSQAVVDRFDDALDRGTEQLLADLGMLTRANMEEQVDRFVRALRANSILPEDF